ncbi:MAG: Alkaline phosphodiesterase I / Nucleotide pyrophosphatase [Nitrospira sp.]|jgi:predicted AlkP superfamily pyrophosphatase or phosphodiesterase|nr:MAG: Alkaline phosphodiesterase I / Nucleotide pyrophosphatase [Nitrospira sp.]
MGVRAVLLLVLFFTPITLFAAPCKQSGIDDCLSLQGSGGVNRADQQDKPYVILVSLDGFRADYLDRFDLPNFRRLIQNGVRAEGLIPVFPSITAPNHYSIVTGLYPERHGLVGNVFYDPTREQVFYDAHTRRDGTWYRGQPIWITAETQGMVTACYFWFECEATIQGIRPSYSKSYDEHIPNSLRVDQILAWLQLPPERRPHLLTLYMSDLDDAGHRFGIESPEIGIAAQAVDQALGLLLDRLKTLSIRDQISVVLVSDHGMLSVSRDKVVWLDSLIHEEPDEWIGALGSYASLHLNPAVHDPIKTRDRLNASLRHGRAYLREELPESLHYRHDRRIGDVVILMDMPYLIMWKEYEPAVLGGEHGWDPTHPDMHGIFVATGPGIKQGATIPAFENVHIYPFLAELLRLTVPEEIDGRAGWLKGLITN